ncbi:hypothetical protein JOS77_04340 [Chromobacterium haemolyticum]|nr:hypothetical protein JOS77_04340 [Chromobacterium haemolyticum]
MIGLLNGNVVFNGEPAVRNSLHERMPEGIIFRCTQEEARELCDARINALYPAWQQLNILRSGSKEEQARMGKFIDACRGWSNSEHPDPSELESIQP